MICFVVDENVPKTVQLFLESFGVCHRISGGISDVEVLKIAREKGCVLVTMDKDFGRLVISYSENLAGVILLRSINIELIKEKLVLVLSKGITGKFVVITDKRVRIRNIKDSQYS